ncbi:OprO/OprP family phosphate-selective porin [Vicingaceae bacterium]|nr:OprO/OprP family phosphate-selective porin [Vicingaceae bacterium]
MAGEIDYRREPNRILQASTYKMEMIANRWQNVFASRRRHTVPAVLLCVLLSVWSANRLSAQQYSSSEPARPFQVATEPYQPVLVQEDSFSNETGQAGVTSTETLPTIRDWAEHVRVGYDSGFVIASDKEQNLNYSDFPFQMRINGWGQLRHTILDSDHPNPLTNPDVNQFQLKRARLVFSGSVFTEDFSYFLQLDGRSSSGDQTRLLDYFLTYDFGHHLWGYDKGTIGFRTGKYKMPFTMARDLSGRELEFSDRSMASIYFDVNRSLAWGLYGQSNRLRKPIHWETAIFNGLVTGGAETGSSGDLDNNFAYSGRVHCYPNGEWGKGELADLDYHQCLATRLGFASAFTTNERFGATEFGSVRVVDTGQRLSSILPNSVSAYDVALFSIDGSLKYQGLSTTLEYYFRNIGGFQGASLPDLYDHGFWFQMGYFIVPNKVELLARWSRVVGKSSTLGVTSSSSDEVAGGFVWYFRDQHAKLTVDVTNLDGAPINSTVLDISPGDIGWLFRTQIQFAF